MRYIELFGLVDDIFAKHRKEENGDDADFTPFGFYKGTDTVVNSYSVYSGKFGIKKELHELIDKYQVENYIKFTEEEYNRLFSNLEETANSQNNSDDSWTDLMFRTKYYFMFELRDILNNYKVKG